MKPVQKLSKELPFIKEIEKLKKEVDGHRPLKKEIQDKILQKLRLDWNYNTNAIEGNSFTRGETVSLLMEGITAKGKPLKDALDIKGHNEAIDILFSLIKEERELNEADIRSLHKIVLGEEYYNPAKTADGKPTRKLIKAGKYKTSPNHVQTPTGAIHYYASVEETPIKMKELVDWYNEVVKLQDVNPVVLAALFHHRFVAIHPFDDGNGRMTRLLTNYILLKFGYPVSVVKQERRREYYATLAQADVGELIPIIELIAETVKDSLEIYLKAINGEDIDEADDIDKEIILFKKEIGIQKEGIQSNKEVDFAETLFELLKYPSDKINGFSEIFNSFKNRIKINPDSRTVNLSFESLKTIGDFRAHTKSVISSVQKVEYNITMYDNVLNSSKDVIECTLIFTFSRLNYSISCNGIESITKLYSEKILNEKYINFIKKVIQQVMIKIKTSER